MYINFERAIYKRYTNAIYGAFAIDRLTPFDEFKMRTIIDNHLKTSEQISPRYGYSFDNSIGKNRYEHYLENFGIIPEIFDTIGDEFYYTDDYTPDDDFCENKFHDNSVYRYASHPCIEFYKEDDGVELNDFKQCIRNILTNVLESHEINKVYAGEQI